MIRRGRRWSFRSPRIQPRAVVADAWLDSRAPSLPPELSEDVLGVGVVDQGTPAEPDRQPGQDGGRGESHCLVRSTCAGVPPTVGGCGSPASAKQREDDTYEHDRDHGASARREKRHTGLIPASRFAKQNYREMTPLSDLANTRNGEPCLVFVVAITFAHALVIAVGVIAVVALLAWRIPRDSRMIRRK